MNYELIAYIAGGLTVFIVYHFNFEPKLRAERDKLVAEIKARLEKPAAPTVVPPVTK